MSYLLGIDTGTSGTKGVLMDLDGSVVSAASVEYLLSQPRAGWAEQDPQLWWDAAVKIIRLICEKTSIHGNKIAAVGLSGQMHGAVAINGYGDVIRPAILWCDQRTEAECSWIDQQVGPKNLYDWTGNPALPGFTAPKILWLRNHEPKTYEKIRHILLPKDYIRFRLTGELATEVSDASGTLLLDVKNRRWSEDMLGSLGIPLSWMPPVFESPHISGRVNRETAKITGLLEGTPVVGGAGDQAAGAVGTGIVNEGCLSVSLGTSGVVFAAIDKPRIETNSSLHTFCHAAPDKWHKMGVMLSAGASMQWFRNHFSSSEDYETLVSGANGISPGSEGLVFLPYLLGERTPYPDPSIRGAFIGLTMRHEKSHLVRAVMEGVSFGLKDSLKLLQKEGIMTKEVRVTGGGAKNSLWQEILASIFNHTIATVNTTEGPAYGAAILAGVGCGVYDSVESGCKLIIKVNAEKTPDEKTVDVYEKYYEVYKSLYPLMKDTMDTLTRLA